MTDCKRRGRPKTDNARQVYEALLDAAEICLEDKPYKAITVRQIAAIADTNPAMINYYFNNKEGLFLALLEFLFSRWEEGIHELTDAMPTLQDSPTRQLVALIDDCFYRHAPVLKLLSRELAEADTNITEAYRDEVVRRIVQAFNLFIEKGAEHGYYNTPHTQNYMTFAVTSLAIHPLSISPEGLKLTYNMNQKEFRSSAWLQHLEEMIDRVLRRD